MVGLGILVGLAVQLGLTVALAWWGARIGRARGGAWRHLVWLPIASFVVGTAGLTLTILGLVVAFQQVASADPAEKARLLSEGISHAMGAAAVSVPIAGLLELVALVGCVAGTMLGPSAPERCRLTAADGAWACPPRGRAATWAARRGPAASTRAASSGSRA